MMHRLTLVLALIAGLTACGDSDCQPLRDLGISSDACPDGDLKLGATVKVVNLERGSLGEITIEPRVLWISKDGQPHQAPLTTEVSATAEVEGHPSDGVFTALETPENGNPSLQYGRIAFPDVPDGDHSLMVTVDAGFDTTRVRVPLQFYTPALIHVLTDRPLYRPGEDVMLRSLVVARSDRTPLPKRPGRWTVTAPDGVVLLDEPAKAGEWGVAASSVPLDANAAHGTYTAAYRSGSDTDAIPFEVRPFELPRTTMEAKTAKAWFSRGDTLAATATARYRSGAPIANAPVKVELRPVQSPWPIPLSWHTPIETKTDSRGQVTVDWGAIPKDLRGRGTHRIEFVLTEEGGEQTVATTEAVLSEDRLRVEVMTELQGALAQGRNNRAYLRVMTPAGKPLPGAEVAVRNPWIPSVPVKRATADEDGVVAIQLDPGEPVTLVTEPMPVRRAPPPPLKTNAPRVDSITEMVNQRTLTLEEQRSIPAIEEAAKRCQDAEANAQRVDLVLRVAPNGSVRGIYTNNDGLTAACLKRTVSSVRFPEGTERTFRAQLQVPDAYLPFLQWEPEDAPLVGEALPMRLLFMGAPTRACLPRGLSEAELGVHWTVSKDSKRVSAQVSDSEGRLTASTRACLNRVLSARTLAEPAKAEGLGVQVVQLKVPQIPGAPKAPPPPQATTSTGFELAVTATSGGQDWGQTSVRFGEGRVPPLRLRADPPVITAGESVTLEFLRSGDAEIVLPKELTLTQDGKEVLRTELEGNKATFEVPKTTDGFLEAKSNGVRALVFVQRADQLTLTMNTDKDTYRPGDTAQLILRTQAGGTGRTAAVGLVGVDASLGDLRPLPGPDAYGRVMVRAQSSQPAFGSFDAHALVLGRIRGKNAAQAAVQRISQIPQDRFVRPRVQGSATVAPDQQSTTQAAFVRVLGEVATQVRAWERTAPEGEQMDNARMGALYTQALKALRDRGEPAIDAYGRELALRVLPQPLLQQLDPRQLVGDGTRLPEDTIPWVSWVTKEVKDG